MDAQLVEAVPVVEEHRILKRNKVTQEMMITGVMEMLVKGLGRREIHIEADQRWGIGRAKIDQLMRLAREQFVRDYESIKREELVAEAIERYDFLYRAGISQRQLSVSIAAMQAKMKMLGIESALTVKPRT